MMRKMSVKTSIIHTLVDKRKREKTGRIHTMLDRKKR